MPHPRFAPHLCKPFGDERRRSFNRAGFVGAFQRKDHGNLCAFITQPPPAGSGEARFWDTI
ncbi:MAG: hypothetical protein A3I11_00125 [Elusimicrobia bacterium RIFCSPLOWO2_02_FULL_39_32]|nr:MAG: hypothetical protein A3B80_03285 [Elusimicrobia bacterium RIFCSPHIGHO2_02_FULL_39_36]OGR91388.1 MAG: hypothetical protein A3I11_00125 [Elusimicrobia bacterium RIFCSPLOWO2_02_FULL_39_32]